VTKKISRDETRELLALIAGMSSQGKAETEPDEGFLKRYLPLPEHARCLDPEVVLIIGDRGAGKTELFRAIRFPNGLEQIRQLGVGQIATCTPESVVDRIFEFREPVSGRGRPEAIRG